MPSNIMYDDSVPEIIKRSIAQANMSDPLRNVQAPENFKEKHYTEHSTHTLCPPKAAMSLAAALENTEVRGKGGRGTELFQKRKARMEKLADADEMKKQQQFNFQPQQVQQVPQPQQIQHTHYQPQYQHQSIQFQPQVFIVVVYF